MKIVRRHSLTQDINSLLLLGKNIVGFFPSVLQRVYLKKCEI